MTPRAASILDDACDRAVAGGLFFLVVFAPLAFGAVHPASIATVEWVAFVCLAAWGVRGLAGGPHAWRLPAPAARLWAPLAGLVGLVAFELVPLPPPVLRAISPATYAFYQTALPGWPERAPYAEAVGVALATAAHDVGDVAAAAPPVARLPTEAEVEGRGLAAFLPPGWDRPAGAPRLAPVERRALEAWVGRGGGVAAWRPLSVAPTRTRAGLTLLLACLAVFAVVAGTPARAGRRRLLRALVVVAFAVAALGLLQRFTWNGRILWFFVPWDWGQPRLLQAQTSGPFVNRNHFAGYLGLLLPLGVVAALSPATVGLGSGRRARLGLGAAVATVATALIWSLSRGGWLSALAGVALCLVLLRRGTRDAERPFFPAGARTALGVVALGAGAAVAFALVPVPGPDPAAPGNDIDVRLEQTLEGPASWERRLADWRDSLPMLADHPLVGVGLGAWGAAFPRYDTSPWLGTRAHRAHNDLLQLVCETGLPGLALSAAALAAVAGGLGRRLSGPSLPVAAAAMGGFCALLLHAFVDFGLRVPAIPLTAAILLGVALGEGGGARTSTRRQQRRAALAALVAAGGGLALVGTQPARLEASSGPASPGRALEQAAAFPTSPGPRLSLASQLGRVSPEAARPVLESAVLLDPRAPGPRDALAAALAASGEREAALAQIEEAVAQAPRRADHAYLAPEVARWLSPDESAAVRRGLARAIPRSGAAAAVSLASFSRDRGDWASAAEAWLAAARHAPSARARAAYLESAGLDFARSGRRDAAERALRRAIALDPADPRPVAALLTRVLGPAGSLDEAAALGRRAVAAGADPYEIELALAEAARRAGDTAAERRALARATARRPGDARAYLALGLSHVRASEWAPASAAFERAVEADPGRASAWYQLGVCEERLYHFDRARRAFEASVREAPDDEDYRRNLERFVARIQAAR